MMQSYAALNTIALAINQGIEKKDISGANTNIKKTEAILEEFMATLDM